MATIKSYTDLEQSKKLAEILSLESADMYYDNIVDSVTGELFIPDDGSTIKVGKGLGGSIVAWSLAALLGVIKSAVDYTMQSLDCKKSFIVCELGDKPWNITAQYDNEIDACVEMIEKLHELNLL